MCEKNAPPRNDQKQKCDCPCWWAPPSLPALKAEILVEMVFGMRGMAKLIVLTMLLINPIRHGGAVSGGEAEVVMVGESEDEVMMRGGGEKEVEKKVEEEKKEERGRLSLRIDSSLPRHLCHRIHKNLKVRKS